MRTHHFVCSLPLILGVAARSHAQCAEWSAGFARPSTPLGVQPSNSIASFDAGNGRRLCSVYEPLGSAEVVRWSGSAWDVLFSYPRTTGHGSSVWSLSDAGTPVLVAASRSSGGANTSDVWRYDGTTVTHMPAVPFGVFGMTSADDGSGVALYAFGAVQIASVQYAGYVARWNGTNWVQLGPTFDAWVYSLTAFDDGTGTRIYAGGSGPLTSTGQPSFFPGSSVASWDGVAWSAVGGLTDSAFALCEFNAELYAGTQVPTFAGSSGLQRLSGGNWTPVGPVENSVYSLNIIDLGSGPTLLLAGRSDAPQPTTMRGVALYDGVQVTTLAGGVSTGIGVRSTCVTDEVGGPRLYAAGDFYLAGGVACRGLASTDGSTWTTIGRGLDQPVAAIARHVVGGSERLAVTGNFNLAGGTYPLQGAALWDGSSWSAMSPSSPNPVGSYLVTLRSIDLGAGPELYAGAVNLPTNPLLGVLRWTGSGWVGAAANIGGNVHALHAFDAGGGPELVAGGNFPGSAAGNNVSRLVSGAWTPFGTGTNGIVAAFETFDEGAGDRLFAGGAFTTASSVATGGIARWNGSAWTAVGAGITGGVNALCSFGGGAGTQLYAGGTFTGAGGSPTPYLARWNGAAWSAVPGGGPDGPVYALCVHDDGRGPALYAGGSFSTIGGVTAYNLARCDGTAWEPVDGGIDGLVNSLASVDDDGDGDRELFVGGNFQRTATVASANIARLEGCPHYTAFCFSDGSFTDHTTACPCGNDGAPGNGCAHSFNAGGANLSATGSTFTDTVVLRSQFEPASSFTLFLQQANQGDAVFHDGVLCAANPLVRLRGRGAVGGEAFFPNSTFAQDTTTSLSIRGGVTIGSGVTRYYSAFYRNASTTFCPPATANVTNGVRIVW